MQELYTDKNHFFKFLSTSDKPWLDQLPNYYSAASRLVVQASFGSFISTRRRNTNKEREIACAKNKLEASGTYQAH